MIPVLLITVLFLLWYTVSIGTARSALEEAQNDLETNRGRERKQEYEYNQVVEEIPRVQAEIDALRPQVDAAEEEESALKADKKKLKKEKSNLEKQLKELAAPDGKEADEP